jgi:signal transduction histidine kinase/CheY-like chemotaxis protein/HAMP domain-containing protein
MKINITIKRRIYWSFTVLVSLFVINGIITFITLHNNKKSSAYLSQVIDPSLQSLDNFEKMMVESKMYTTNWVFLRYKQKDKNSLKEIHSFDYVTLRSRIDSYAQYWLNKNWTDSLNNVYAGFEGVLVKEKAIMESLKMFDDYDDPVTRFVAETKLEEEILPRTDALINSLHNISNYVQSIREQENIKLTRSTKELRILIILLAATIIFAGFFLSIYLANVIISPVNKIRSIINDLGKGIIRRIDYPVNRDEIGEMVQSVNNLSENLRDTANFAYEVGKRNFNIPFTPLSIEDTLGKALISMRDNLKASEMELMDMTGYLNKKDRLLQAVGSAVHELISNNDFETAIGNAIKLLGGQMGVDMISTFRNYTDSIDDKTYSSQLACWNSVTNEVEYRVPEFQQVVVCFTPDIKETLQRNEIFHCNVTHLKESLIKEWLENKQVTSLTIIPVFAENKLWGFISIHDCRIEREWTRAEFSILESFSDTLGSAIERIHMEQQKNNAEAASIAKSEFMANMSHELRTPMNGIIGFTDLVLTTNLQKTQRQYLQNVQKSAYNLLNIINDILDFSKIEAGKLIIDNACFKLDELIEETIDILSIKAQEKDLELVCNIAPQIPSQFFGDPVRIRQILVNLIGNAIKFTLKGEVSITILQESSPYEKNDKKFIDLAIAVKDTGIGIASEKINAIFESFTQADSSTTRKFGGSGLGLTISKRLAELMDGNLQVESEFGKGSTFTLRLAMEIVSEQPSIAFASKGVLGNALVIDDNMTNCKLMEDIFRYLHIPCTICYNGPEALQVIEKAASANNQFDLIITDNQMPEMDGITLVQQIKKITKADAIPFILMLSSLEMTTFQQKAENIGIDKFLSKPVKLGELANLISSLFENPHSHEVQSDKIHAPEKSFQGTKILVAEDNPLNMALISEVLLKMGVKVIEAVNGREAIELLIQHDPELVFMDVNMPEIDGYLATQKIRRLPQPYSDVPIIALTADAMKEDKELCLKAGMNHFISKPFRLEEIEFIMNSYLKKNMAI